MKWLTTMAAKDGVGLNRLQLTTRMSIWLAFSPAAKERLVELVPGRAQYGMGNAAALSL